MEKTLKVITQAKQDGEAVQCYIRDLNTWENEMKKKEAALKDEEAQQVLPPVRTKQKRDKYKKKTNRKRPANTDQPCEESDSNKPHEEMEDVGPLSLTLDHKQSEVIKQMQVKEEAQYQKERGNKFVKVERWDDAISCYNRAIQLVKDDAIYYANRGLCYLKKDSLHQAEQDCTEALRLDPTYVKALQRRATARERLGSLRAATSDLNEVIKLEPNNTAARRQLESIKIRMGTKGRKAKSSPVTKMPTSPSFTTSSKDPPAVYQIPTPKEVQNTETPQLKMVNPTIPQGKILGVPRASQMELDIKPTPILKVELNGTDRNIDNWKDGVGENVLVIKPVKKPPHLRSKRALKSIPIREIPLGKTNEEMEKLEKPATRMKIIEIDSEGDTNNNDKIIEKIDTTVDNPKTVDIPKTVDNPKTVDTPKTVDNPKTIDNPKTVNNPKTVDIPKTVDTPKTIDNGSNNVINEVINEMKKTDVNENVKIGSNLKVSRNDMIAPTNSVQFMSEWRNLKGNDSARCDYLCLLQPTNIPKVFANALESGVLSDIIQVLYNNKERVDRVTDYLKGLSRVKRLSALVMFLESSDKELLNKLLVHCKTLEGCSDADIADLKNKYEL